MPFNASVAKDSRLLRVTIGARFGLSFKGVCGPAAFIVDEVSVKSADSVGLAVGLIA